LKTIRDAIPDHCFKRSLTTSLMHLFSDLAIIGTLFYLASWISHPVLPPWSKYLLWPLYWGCQGSVMTGLWVLAHECGHQAFSDYAFVNNFVGTICHSALLVPYHSWRITHGKHHNNTGSVENDEVFCHI
jgi:omega-6 fatty acid desaturase (delta-12 desaturase)